MSWTETTQPKYRRDHLRYASDTTDEEWAIIVPHRPARHRRGRPRRTDLRAVVNAIFYIAQTGCQWRMLPKEFAPFTTVQGYFYQWRDEGWWATINHAVLMRARSGGSRGEPDRRRPRPSPGQALTANRSRRPRRAARAVTTPPRK